MRAYVAMRFERERGRGNGSFSVAELTNRWVRGSDPADRESGVQFPIARALRQTHGSYGNVGDFALQLLTPRQRSISMLPKFLHLRFLAAAIFSRKMV